MAEPSLLVLPLILVTIWFVALAVVIGRIYFVRPYAVVSILTPALEPFGMTPLAFPVCIALASVWTCLATSAGNRRPAMLYLLIASAPVLLWLVRVLAIADIKPWFVEGIWLSGWTGLSFGSLVNEADIRARLEKWTKRSFISANALLWMAIATCAVWWYCQLTWYHNNFLLGYNDYGHFLQRLANTLSGRGWLVETPVLPRFWDHFNPGLLGLLPLWSLWPDVHQSFIWQAASLAISGYLVYRIAQALQHSRSEAALFGLAWLAQPSVGQMNVAFTYGWHPITLAIPLLLATIWALLVGRRWLALVSCLIALSMEEGVFVIVSLTALSCGCWRLWRQWRTHPTADQTPETRPAFYEVLTARSWLIAGVLAAVAFVLVVKFSGLAEFQTGRFVKLGSNTTEILLSPILRPAVFWGSLLAFDRWIYLLLLWLPCGLPALWRGRLYILPTLLPLGVLTVWDHPPAHCIAFQYASTLLPLFWLATVWGASTVGSRNGDVALSSASTALVTGILLSLFAGQLPFSSWTLLDVDGQTYGPSHETRRRASDSDGVWLTEQVRSVRSEPGNCLATGRVAAHLVGMPDIETVGQYIERRDRLRQLKDRAEPISHYQWIVLDRLETFQQTVQQTKLVEEEVRAAQFEEVAQRYDIVIFKRRSHAQSPNQNPTR